MSARPREILLVEDNEGDVQLLHHAWEQWSRKSGLPVHLSVLHDSHDTIPALRGGHPTIPQLPYPDLIMLDYKMPLDGGMAIVELKGDPAFLHIPLVAFTGSADERDHLDIYQRGANCCYRKPHHLDRYIALIDIIGTNWLQFAQLPPERWDLRPQR